MQFVPTWTPCKQCNNNDEDKPLNPLTLEGSSTLTIGRGADTQISDKRCSRVQMRLESVIGKQVIRATCLGRNPSAYVEPGGGRTRTFARGQTVEIQAASTLAPVEGSLQSYRLETMKRVQAVSGQASASKRQKVDLDTALVEEESFGSCIKLTKMDRSSGSFEWFEDTEDKSVYVGRHKDSINSKQIASFDMDGTLITTASGRRFPTHPGDWRFFNSHVPGKLQALHKKEFKVVLLTNQAGLATGQSKFDELASKLEAISKRVIVPFTVIIAASNQGNIYRKPRDFLFLKLIRSHKTIVNNPKTRTGMWNLLREQFNAGIPFEMTDSFYVGDAAGRIANPKSKSKADHSSADRLFALNLELKFYTPETYFSSSASKKEETFVDTMFNPRSLSSANDHPPAIVLSDKAEIFVMVGLPGSGKSTFANRFAAKNTDIVVVSNDVHKGGQTKSLSLLKHNLDSGKSVILDNTHVDKSSRQAVLAAARAHSCKCRALVLQLVSPDHARHNCCFRELANQVVSPTNPGTPSVPTISTVVFNTMRKRYERPTVEEGFDEVIEVPFVPNFGGDSKLSRLYNMFLLDK